MVLPIPVSPFAVSRSSRLLALALLAAACSSNNNSSPAIGVADEPVVGTYDALPGVVVTIEDVRGTTSGKANVGDLLEVDFTVATTGGDPLELSTMARGAIMVSGPTSNYQRVIASQGDVLTAATKRAIGAYTYKFSVPIPSTYLAPLNDTGDLTEGEMTGETLLSGTYTVGIEIRKDYTVDGTTYRDPGNASFDFLLGSATTLEPREVVTLAHCNVCHTELHAHGDNRDKIVNCLLCHTSGSEDRNTSSVAGGTPGVSIDFKVMIHKIHAGAFLPSVLGVTTNSDGSRKYDATPQPYEMIGYGDSLIDFSEIEFPAWPSFYTGMPRDQGYTTLTSGQQSLENSMRKMPAGCDKCHGDPDGDGPIAAPAQGDLIWTQPTIAACSSCHDDWNPDYPYVANGLTMPAQPDNETCTVCHADSGSVIAVQDAHRHPLADPDVALGLHVNVTAVTDNGGNDNGKFDAGERIQITFQVVDDSETPVTVSALSRLEATLTGPTENPQAVTYIRVAPAYFTGTGPFTVNLPALVFYEPIGTSNGSFNTFATALTPVWNVTGAATTLLRRTGVGNSSTLAAGAEVAQNYIDVADGTQFANGDYIVIDDLVSGTREYMRIQWVEDNRLWFGNQFRTTYKPALLRAHAINATVDVVTTSSVSSSNYTVDPETGVITETVEFGAGEILCNYTSDFVVPSVYPGALEDTPTNGQDWGDWTGLNLLDGTYRLELHAARSLTVTRAGENTSYTEASDGTITDLLFGAATEATHVLRVDGAALCNKCHDSIQFHGGSRRGAATCIACHSTAGAELTPLYENQSTGAWGTPVEFRYIAHEFHEGVFPAMPGGVQDCAVCHGADNTAWVLPATRLHPDQTVPTRAWNAACSSCHSSTAAVAHIVANTSPSGYEACLVCHGEGKELNVRTVHALK